MEVIDELLPGVLLFKIASSTDIRGSFTKTYHRMAFQACGICFDVREMFFSVSGKGVLRGMHFQAPPHDHAKLVACAAGRAIDVVLDLRPGPGYGRYAAADLTAVNGHGLFLPHGLAHGFLSLDPDTILLYATSAEHHAAADLGIRWDSFGYEWGIRTPTLSQRDASLPCFDDFETPF